MSRDLDQVVETAAEKLQGFAANRIVPDNREMWTLWEAVRVLAIRLRNTEEPKTGARALHRGRKLRAASPAPDPGGAA